MAGLIRRSAPVIPVDVDRIVCLIVIVLVVLVEVIGASSRLGGQRLIEEAAAGITAVVVPVGVGVSRVVGVPLVVVVLFGVRLIVSVVRSSLVMVVAAVMGVPGLVRRGALPVMEALMTLPGLLAPIVATGVMIVLVVAPLAVAAASAVLPFLILAARGQAAGHARHEQRGGRNSSAQP